MIEAERLKECACRSCTRTTFVDRLVAEIIGRTVDVTLLEPAAGQPQREARDGCGRAVVPLRDRQPAELSRPQSRLCRIQEPAV